MLFFLMLLQDDPKELQARAMVEQLERAVVLYAEAHGAFPPSLETLAEKKFLLVDAVPKDPWGEAFLYKPTEADVTIGARSASVTLQLKSIGRVERSEPERVGALVGAAVRAYHRVNKKLPDGLGALSWVDPERARRVTLQTQKEGARIAVTATATGTLDEKQKVKLAEQVQRLSSDDFAAREEASQAIEAFGAPALEAIAEAIGKTGDPEAAARLKQIERRLSAQIKERQHVGFVILKSGSVVSNQRNASASLKSCVTAQENFRSNDLDRNAIADYWTGDVAGLYCLQVKATGNAIAALNDIGVASADARRFTGKFENDFIKYDAALLLNHWPKTGYLYEAMTTDDVHGSAYAENTGDGHAVHNYGRFGFVAYPAEYGVTGRMTFIVSEGAWVFQRDTGGKPVLTFPKASELAAQWSKVE